MRVLLDNGVISWSEMAVGAVMEKVLTWNGVTTSVRLHGFQRKSIPDSKMRSKVELLPTIGRLIRNDAVQAFTYIELDYERIRGRVVEKKFNALKGCKVSHIPSAIERSKLNATSNLSLFMRKGGKKDSLGEEDQLQFTQIGFVEKLITLSAASCEAWIRYRSEIGLSDFEIENLRNLHELRSICDSFQSRENYPDAFHLWTAHCNKIDVFLTMEDRLPNLYKNLSRIKRKAFQPFTVVLTPADLLERLGIKERIPVAMEEGRFYNFLYEEGECN